MVLSFLTICSWDFYRREKLVKRILWPFGDGFLQDLFKPDEPVPFWKFW
jgi:hypothetical protein